MSPPRGTGEAPSSRPRPSLITVAHGTRDQSGNDVAEAITRAAGAALGVPALTTYVELSAPLLADETRALTGPAIVVPLLLSTGFHVRQDLPEAVSPAGQAVTLTPPLGPDLALAQVARARLIQAGADPAEPTVLVAAGSRDPAAADDLAQAAALLGEVWRGPVHLATLTGPGPGLADTVRQAASTGPTETRVAVAPYLLAPGYFATRTREESRAAGAAVVAGVIGCHRYVVDLIVRRYAHARVAEHSQCLTTCPRLVVPQAFAVPG
ncbi:MAG: sirohydrochlorin chelatase [Nocardioides sp.]